MARQLLMFFLTGRMADWERWNTHFSTVVEQEVLGYPFRLSQDPNSENLGTTVWDASIVLAKYLEKNSLKGEFSKKRVWSKRAIELGSGMGLGGMAFMLLGCKEVVLTDLKEVLPLLRKNVERNMSPTALMGSPFENGVGRISVAELDWTNREQCSSLEVPFDYVLAADCVYHENHLHDFLATILAITDNKSTVLVVNELRSESVQDEFMSAFGEHFTIRKVSHSQMHPTYQHPSVDILILKRKWVSSGQRKAVQGATASTDESNAQSKELSSEESANDDQPLLPEQKSKPQTDDREDKEWENRRLGTAAAQMMKDVKIP
ncbi:hypothetical protein BSKO_01531 [Bryopsis sp. KO-2023]|nr:hypothetical protein BSKO_01531 [Bryopsis sp. KO-2023]